STAIKREIAARRQGLDGEVGGLSGERLHRQVVGDQHTLEADPLTNDALDDERRESRGQGRVECRVDDVSSHHPRQIRVARERQEVGVEMVRLHRREGQMAEDRGAAVAWGGTADWWPSGGG